jgi:hypothetical protein
MAEIVGTQGAILSSSVLLVLYISWSFAFLYSLSIRALDVREKNPE